jgi:hypothetical protein
MCLAVVSERFSPMSQYARFLDDGNDDFMIKNDGTFSSDHAIGTCEMLSTNLLTNASLALSTNHEAASFELALISLISLIIVGYLFTCALDIVTQNTSIEKKSKYASLSWPNLCVLWQAALRAAQWSIVASLGSSKESSVLSNLYKKLGFGSPDAGMVFVFQSCY